MTALPILYQDEHLVAVNKPTGVLVHRSAVDRSASEHAMTMVRDQLGQWVYPFHRLDRATSGVLVFALDQETARRMTRSFTDGTVDKSYLAVVRGLTAETERIDHPLLEHRDRKADLRAKQDKPVQAAVTEYQRLATIELPHAVGRYSTARYSLIMAKPLTGRTHQIRRHMKHIFHPVIGDTTYGDGKQNGFFRARFGCRRLLLHARAIGFQHPFSGRQLLITAPLDQDLDSLLRELNWAAVIECAGSLDPSTAVTRARCP